MSENYGLPPLGAGDEYDLGPAEPNNAADYFRAGYASAYETLAAGLRVPPSFEVFATGLFRFPSMTPAAYAKRLVDTYRRAA